MKVVTENPPGISVQAMCDGDVAIITQWGTVPDHTTDHVGKVVQRYNDSLIVLGQTAGKSWPGLFKPFEVQVSIDISWDDCRVRVLDKGTILEI